MKKLLEAFAQAIADDMIRDVVRRLIPAAIESMEFQNDINKIINHPKNNNGHPLNPRHSKRRRR